MRIGRVISSSVGVNRDGETPVRLLQVEISDPDDIQTVEYAQAAGEDFNPPPDTTVFILEAGEAWKLAIGADDGIAPSAGSGERRIYAVDPITKLIASLLVLLTDGTIEAGTTGLDFVAQAGKIDQIIAGIMSVFSGWTPVPNDGGAALKTAWSAQFPTPPGSVASANLKSED